MLLQDVDDICGAFGWGPASPLLLTDEGTGERPEHLWLGFYATSVVLARILVDAGVRADVCLGHSSGEVTALVAAGALRVAPRYAGSLPSGCVVPDQWSVGSRLRALARSSAVGRV